MPHNKCIILVHIFRLPETFLKFVSLISYLVCSLLLEHSLLRKNLHIIRQKAPRSRRFSCFIGRAHFLTLAKNFLPDTLRLRHVTLAPFLPQKPDHIDTCTEGRTENGFLPYFVPDLLSMFVCDVELFQVAVGPG